MVRLNKIQTWCSFLVCIGFSLMSLDVQAMTAQEASAHLRQSAGATSYAEKEVYAAVTELQKDPPNISGALDHLSVGVALLDIAIGHLEAIVNAFPPDGLTEKEQLELLDNIQLALNAIISAQDACRSVITACGEKRPMAECTAEDLEPALIYLSEAVSAIEEGIQILQGAIIPTLTEWGLILFVILLLATGARMLRKRRREITRR
jgi:hypothetical protein